jgi:dCMP deaminase
MAEIHPLPEAEPAPDRIPLEEVYMRMAEELAKRSTCARLQVGTVITTSDLTQVLGIGYNGNARGLPNRCDSTTPGSCGCLHSEQNALIKAGAQLPGKVMFVSASPCVMCAKMAINANVARVYYREAYRDPAGLDTLRQGGVEVIHYNRWRDSLTISQPSSVWTICGSTIGTSLTRRARVRSAAMSSASAADSSTARVA